MVEAPDGEHQSEATGSREPPGKSDGAVSSAPKPGAVKDRVCKYCKQAFTSSSLGRHLDQYLFKKKPDGIHDIEEIRRIRSAITRRQARSSTKQRDTNANAARKEPHAVTPADSNASSASGTDGSQHGPRYLFNMPTWQATGVINDVQNPDASQRSSVSSQNPPTQSQTTTKPPADYTTRATQPGSSGSETARALELALREVLDNVKAAASRVRASRLSPFDFDVQAQTFPSLVLQLLPLPPALFSTHPFGTASSIPLDPPGFAHVEVVRNALRARIEQWRTEQLAIPSSSPSDSREAAPSNDPNVINSTAQQHEEISSRHLDLAYQHWMLLPQDVRRDTWQLELMRAFARETDKRKELEEQLARVQQEANQLREEIHRISSCQWPREFALFPPDMLPLSREIVRELEVRQGGPISADSPRWDFDNVVAKWKRVVMHDKGMGRVGIPRDTERPTSIDSGNAGSSMANTHTQAGENYTIRPSNSRSNSYYEPPEKRRRQINETAKSDGRDSESDSPSAADVSGNRDSATNTWSPGSVQGLLRQSQSMPMVSSTLDPAATYTTGSGMRPIPRSWLREGLPSHPSHTPSDS